MFRHRLPLRRWAACVLLIWLFGLGTSIANACITTGQVVPAAATASHPVAAVDAHHDAASHDHALADGSGLPSHRTDVPAHHGSLSKANCQDFCDKATVSIPPLKSALDDVQSHAVIATATMPFREIRKRAVSTSHGWSWIAGWPGKAGDGGQRHRSKLYWMK